MMSVMNKTDAQVRVLGLQAVRRELGIIGLIRFMQQFDIGEGDYTHDRDAWQDAYTVDSLASAILQTSAAAELKRD